MFTSRPTNPKTLALALSLLLFLWLYKLNAGSYILPSRDETWVEKHIEIIPKPDIPVLPDPPSNGAGMDDDDDDDDDGKEVELPQVSETAVVEVEVEGDKDVKPEGTKAVEVEVDKNGKAEDTKPIEDGKPVNDVEVEGDKDVKPGDTPPAAPLSSPKKISKTVIMGKTKSEDATWVKAKLPDWRRAIYAVDSKSDKSYLHVAVNKGREAMPYLTYLIDYYDDLSDVNVFIHSHEDGYPRAWHNEPQSVSYSAPKMLSLLSLPNILQKGYVNLRCNGLPGCPGELHPNSTKEFKKDDIEPGWRKLWTHINNNTDFPETVGVACCAQFAVTREKVREREKGYYEGLMEWLLQTEVEDAGRVFEYFWHIIFGMPVVHCEGNYNKCICETYDCGAAARRRSVGWISGYGGV